MISILIPVYNYDVVALAKELSRQCQQRDIVFQILVFDDKSKDEFKAINQIVSQEFNVSYVEMSENKGRAKIRNRLAKMAQYDWLLFLDCDSKVISDTFIDDYLRHLQEPSVIFGGRVYQQKKPNNDYLTHWAYGTKVESKSASKRKGKPYISFHSNNFLIHRSIFDQVQFREDIDGYGYEDLYFAEEVKLKGIVIKHIDNPVLHEGLDNNISFTLKTENAIKNLSKLNKDGHLKSVKLSQYYLSKSVNPLYYIVMISSKKMYKIAERKMKRGTKNMLWIQLYKLYLYDKYIQEG